MHDQVRHLFPGNNTPLGFYSYYEYMLPQAKATHIFCVKGGPGVGKSTFMKRIGKDMVDKGHPVEYMHCSSDPNSLDGVVITDIGVALLDGTAPHVVDPKHPAAVDEIINLGDYWDEKAIKEHREDIVKDTKEIGLLFKRAYRYLAAAGNIMHDMEQMRCQAMNVAGADYEARELIQRELSELIPTMVQGSMRKLFLTAITPDGMISYLDTAFHGCDRIYVLEGAVGTYTERVLRTVAQAAMERGLDVEAFYCPMDPNNRLEHLMIPRLKVAFTTANAYHSLRPYNTLPIKMEKYADIDRATHDIPDMVYSKATFDSLLAYAVSNIRRAKDLHDHLETFYVPYMDFDAEEELRRGIVDRILAWK